MIGILCGLLFLRGAQGAVINANNGANNVVNNGVNNGVNLVGGMNSNDQVRVKTFTVETGASVGRLAVLNDYPPAGGCVVFMDAAVGCDGKIGYWQFYSIGAGYICFGIFNRKKNTKTGEVLFESAGKNCVNVTDHSTGFKEIEVPPIQQLSVNPSSVVAVHYDSASVPEADRVITVESNIKPEKFAGVTLGKIMVIPSTHISAGQFFKEEAYEAYKNGALVTYTGMPSFKAIVLGMSRVLDLRNGNNSRSGVAMIYMNDVWGTMCDRWYHLKGWPFLFCAEKDFPDTEDIYFTDNQARNIVPEGTPIHLKNPRCKFSQNVTMFSCATHDNVTCNHTNDLFIKCKSKVELRKGANAKEGICYVYESNYWGTICDKRPLELHEHHWAHVCCRERGFDIAETLRYADPVSNSGNVGYPDPISMHSPVCMGGKSGADIKMCKDGPLEDRCTHAEDVFVTCSWKAKS